MKQKFFIFVVTIAFAAISNSIASANCDPVKIMPLGDSITAGLRSPDFVSYRRELWLRMEDAGYNVDFVGSRSTDTPNPDYDNDHEGHSGWTAAEIGSNVYDWLSNNPADIILLHAGTNELKENIGDIEIILNQVDMFEADFNKTVTVIVAQIINLKSYSQTVSAFNHNLYNLVEARKAASDNIILVDMEHALIYPDDMSDREHPNLYGYEKMANVWFTALEPLLPICNPPIPGDDIYSPVFSPVPQKENVLHSTPPEVTISIKDLNGLSAGYWSLDGQEDMPIFENLNDYEFITNFTLTISEFDALFSGFHTITFRVVDNAGNQTSFIWRFLTFDNETRVNAGGNMYTDSLGNVWSPDFGYNTGASTTTTKLIADTDDSYLFQTGRWDDSPSPEMQYRFNLPNGQYLVRLYFAETWSGAAGVGLRVFDVMVEDTLVWDDLDIFSEAGLDTALVKSTIATVYDGELNIEFLHEVQHPSIRAIEIITWNGSADTDPPDVPDGLLVTSSGWDRINFTWDVSADTGGSGLAGYIVYRDGNEIGTTTSPGYLDTGLSPETEYFYTVAAYDLAGNLSAESAALFVITGSASDVAFRVNAGGNMYTDSLGNVWSPDFGHNTGKITTTTKLIADTDDSYLFQTGRWDDSPSPEMQYRFNLPNGQYLVRLYFAETWSGAAGVGLRVFDVMVEDTLVWDDLDIFSEAGLDTALVKSTIATVYDGELNIEFLHEVQHPSIRAIEIITWNGSADTDPPDVPDGLLVTSSGWDRINFTWDVSADTGGSGLAGYIVYRDGNEIGTTTSPGYLDTGLSPETEYFYTVAAYDLAGNLSAESAALFVITGSASDVAFRVNAGGNMYTDSLGNVWSPDFGHNTGKITTTTKLIADTDDSYLFQTGRWDDSPSPEMQYRFNLPNGQYLVRLYFAETWSGAAGVGLRVFDVMVEDTLVWDDLDIFSEAGLDTALVKSTIATVYDGELNIEFLHEVQHPSIRAIEIITWNGSADNDPPDVPDGLLVTSSGWDRINFTWDVSADTGGSGLAGYIVYRDGNEIGTTTSPGYLDTGLSPETEYFYTVAAYDLAGNLSAESAALFVITGSASDVAFRVNAGGNMYTDSLGNVWSPDFGHNTGKITTTTKLIADTDDSYLFQTGRWDDSPSPEMQYRFNLPNGQYLVRLYFAETWSGAAGVGLRVFDVMVEDTLVWDDLDIFSEVGFDTALIKSSIATVYDGELNIEFLHEVQHPSIRAIEITKEN